MDDKKYIVALEIASSHIAGVVARVDDAASHDASVVCYHEVSIIDCVRYGCIVNVDEVCNKVNLLLQRITADHRLGGRKIRSVYVALCARSLHTRSVEINRVLNESIPVTREFINQISREARNSVDNQEVVAVVPGLFEIDGVEIANPVGAVGSQLHAVMNVITCRPQIRRNILMVFDRLGLKVNDFVVTPVATAQVLLSPEERKLGCVLVDHGAETTTVTIYKNDRLMYLNVLPMGSRNITRDLVSLKIVEEQADKIKRNYGDAMSAGSDLAKLDISGVSSLDVSNYVTSRAGEMMENVYNQLQIAGFTPEQLPAGFVVVGRGMKLNRLPDLLQSISKMPVRMGKIKDINEPMELAKVPQLLSVVNEISGMSSLSSCLEMPMMKVPEDYVDIEPEDTTPIKPHDGKEEKQKENKKSKPSIFERIINKITDGVDQSFREDGEQN